VVSRFFRASLALLFASAGAVAGCGHDPAAGCDVDDGIAKLLQLTPQQPPITLRLHATLLVDVPLSAGLGALTSSNPHVTEPTDDGVVTTLGSKARQYRLTTTALGTTVLSAKPLSASRRPGPTWSTTLTVQCHPASSS